MDRRNQSARTALFQRTKRRIALRVRAVCGGMPAEEFDALVSRMATVEIKYAMRKTADFFREKGMEGRSEPS